MIQKLAVAALPLLPKSLVWRVSKRYIAGDNLESALEVVAELNRRGMRATLDVLGEDTTNEADANAARDEYLVALDRIAAQELDCNVSVKLSQMALRFDDALCRKIAREIAEKAWQLDNFLRIDMEDSSVTDATLDIYRELRDENRHVGTVVQSCLRRTEADCRELCATGETNLRLCKGIYIESEKVAFTDREEVRESFRKSLRALFEGGAWRVAIATHDDALVEDAEAYIREHKIPKERYEFQMLLGVTERIRNRLVAAGHPLRVYVPFGKEWYAYSSRRLRENPNIAGHVMKNMLFGR